MGAYTNVTSAVTKVNAIVMFDGWHPKDIKARYPKFKAYLDENAKLYGFVLHEMDVLEDGQMKKPHVHACFQLKKRKRLSTVINDLAKVFDVGNLAVTCKKMSTFEGSFQYLIHKNNPEKFHYSIKDVVTNLDDEEIDTVLNSRSVGLEYEELHAICVGSETMLDVMRVVGLGTYQHYRTAIRDMWDFVQTERARKKV